MFAVQILQQIIRKCRERFSLSPATVLVGKLKFFIFEEVVHEDDEFAHASGHRHQWFFSGGEQARIKLFKNAVMPHGAQGGHVERTPHGPPTAADVAHALQHSAVAIIRGHARQGGGGLRVEFSQFEHFGPVVATTGPTPAMASSRLAFRARSVSAAMRVVMA